MIDKFSGLGPLNGISKYGNAQNIRQNANASQADKIDMSQKSIELYEYFKLKETAEAELAKVPDVRVDRVEEMKLKINDPNYYNNPDVLNGLVDRLIDSQVLNPIVYSDVEPKS